jgi:hypothetical protein
VRGKRKGNASREEEEVASRSNPRTHRSDSASKEGSDGAKNVAGAPGGLQGPTGGRSPEDGRGERIKGGSFSEPRRLVCFWRALLGEPRPRGEGPDWLPTWRPAAPGLPVQFQQKGAGTEVFLVGSGHLFHAMAKWEARKKCTSVLWEHSILAPQPVLCASGWHPSSSRNGAVPAARGQTIGQEAEKHSQRTLGL